MTHEQREIHRRKRVVEYAEVAGTATLPFDVVWFTPRVSQEDPRETFRKALEKMAETSPGAHEAEASTPDDPRKP